MTGCRTIQKDQGQRCGRSGWTTAIRRPSPRMRKRLHPRTFASIVAAIILVLVAEPLEGARAAFAPGIAEPLSGIAPRSAEASVAAALPPFAIHVASTLDKSRPAPVLVVLHGFGSSGQEMIAPFVAEAERLGWIVVAPTFNYRDWTDPEQVRLDEASLIPAIRGMLESLPGKVGTSVESRALIFGFSRGAQLGHRYAFFYPETVRGVVTVGAGTYTLPRPQVQTEKGNQTLAFPYGISDLANYTGRQFDPAALQRIPFLIAVGATDNRRTDVPRQWDAIEGSTRVERAQTFVAALNDIGVHAELRVVPFTDHEVTSIIRDFGCDFLQHSPG
jgi:pimeloyl-ACP methyl ester carboxylesterase